MGIRRQARECALQMLYQIDMSGAMPAKAMAGFWSSVHAVDDVKTFSEELVVGVTQALTEIDDLISRHSTNWKLSRMATIDRNILRLATFELTRRADIPAKVTINEAVEIAKQYGTADSGAFVNGILDKIARERGDGSVPEPDAAAEAAEE